MYLKKLKSFFTGLSLIILVGIIPTNLNAQKITELFKKEQYEKAEKYCAKQKADKQIACYKELADAYFGIQDFEKAAEFYPKTNNPEEGYLKIAKHYFIKEAYEKAAEYYAKTNNSEKAYLKIADIYFAKDEFEKAAEYYVKTSYPKNGYLKIAEAYLNKKDCEKAAGYYIKTENPKTGYLKIAEHYLNNNEYDKAAEYYSKTEYPKTGYLKIAEAYINNKEYEKAEEYYAKTEYPKKGYLKIAEHYIFYNNREKAEEFYKKTIDNPTEYLVDSWINLNLIRNFNYTSLLVNKDVILTNKLNEILTNCQTELGKDMLINILESVHKVYEEKFFDLLDKQSSGKSVREYDISLNMTIAKYLNAIINNLKVK